MSDEYLRLAHRQWLADPEDLPRQTEYFSQLLRAGYDGLSLPVRELLLPVAQRVLDSLELAFQAPARPYSALANQIELLRGSGLHSSLSTHGLRPGSILATQYLGAYQTQNLWQLISGFNSVDNTQRGHIGHDVVTSVSVYFAPHGLGIRQFIWLTLAPNWIPEECPLDSLAKMQQYQALPAIAPIDLVPVDDGFRVNNFASLHYSEIPLRNAQDFWDLLQRLT